MIQMKTNWNDLFKIRLANPTESFDKHEVIKIMIVRKLLRLHKKRHFIKIYTEWKLNGCTADVYMEDLRTHSVICWEIQKTLTPKYEKLKKEQYEKINIPYMKTIDLIIVPLKSAPENISELNLWLDKYCF